MHIDFCFDELLGYPSFLNYKTNRISVTLFIAIKRLNRFFVFNHNRKIPFSYASEAHSEEAFFLTKGKSHA